MLYSYQSIIIGSSILLLRGIWRMGPPTNLSERAAQLIGIKDDFVSGNVGSIDPCGEIRLPEWRDFSGITRAERGRQVPADAKNERDTARVADPANDSNRSARRKREPSKFPIQRRQPRVRGGEQTSGFLGHSGMRGT
jgi:hypothetical protein